MARPPLAVGTFGKIGFLKVGPGRVRARARFRDYDGVVRPVSRYGLTRPKAEAALREALRDRGTPVQDEVHRGGRVAQLAAAWLADVEERDLSAATKEMYADVAQRHVVPALGALRLTELTVPVLDRFVRLVSKTSGPGTAKTARTVLSGMLGLAVRHGALEHNPMRDVGRIAKVRRDVRALTPGETADLRVRLRSDPRSVALDLPDLVDFLLATGMRIGEACALRWAAVDLDHGTVEVRATVERTKAGGLTIQERTKTAAGRRVIAIPDSTVRLLRRRQPPRPRPENVIFASPLGQVRDRSNTTGDLRRAFDRAGYPWITSHTLRKTVATRLDDAGLTARQIADQLGHARPSLTQDVYMGRKVASTDAARILEL
jgi:integrase